jgi:hypothetical protein
MWAFYTPTSAARDLRCPRFPLLTSSETDLSFVFGRSYSSGLCEFAAPLGGLGRLFQPLSGRNKHCHEDCIEALLDLLSTAVKR